MAASRASWDIEPEDIIREVKSRPLLYNRTIPQYNNKMLKSNTWEEIARNVSKDWAGLSKLERDIRSRDLQAKWKHIRDNFRRECQGYKEINPTMKKKRRKYRYFDQLLFLKPYIHEGSNYRKNAVKRVSTVNTEEINNLTEEKSTKIRERNPETITRFEDEILKAVYKNNSDTDDDDKAFCFSLVKPMKNIRDADKLSARIEILNVIKRFTYPEIELVDADTVVNEYFEVKSDIAQCNANDVPSSNTTIMAKANQESSFRKQRERDVIQSEECSFPRLDVLQHLLTLLHQEWSDDDKIEIDSD